MKKVVLIIGVLFSMYQLKAQDPVELVLSHVTGAPGDVVRVECRVNNFTNIELAQFALSWDASKLEANPNVILGDLVPSSTLANFQVNSTLGTFRSSWNSIPSVTLPDGALFFAIDFTITGENTEEVAVLLDESVLGVECAYTGPNNETILIDLVAQAGSVSIDAGTQVQDSLEFILSQVTGVSGDVVRVECHVNNFTNLEIAQFALSWDASKLEASTSVTLGDLIPTSTLANFQVNPTMGTLRSSWNSIPSVTVPDGDLFFALDFTILETCSGSFPIQLDESILSVECAYTGGSGATTLIDLSVEAGSVTIDAMEVNVSTVANQTCDDGQIQIDVSGGTPPYTYAWSHDAAYSGASATGLYPDTYFVTVTDDAGCSVVKTIALPMPASIEPITLDVNICDGDSYEYNGAVYTATGNYTDQINYPGGCTVPVYINLTVVESIVENDQASICEGASYSFGGVAYTEAGTYQQTFASQLGCDSIVNLTLEVLSVQETNLAASICEGESYSFGGIAYTEAGSYQQTFASQLGCDSIVTLTLEVLPLQETYLTEAICEGESISVGGESYTASGSYSNVLTGYNGCDSTVFLDLTVYSVQDVVIDTIIQLGELYNGVLYEEDTTIVELYNDNVTGCDYIVTSNIIVDFSGVFDNNRPDFKVMVSPNPMSSSSNIEIGVEGNVKGYFSLYGVMGNVVKEYSIDEQRFTMERGDIPAGIYIYRIRLDSGEEASGRVVVE